MTHPAHIFGAALDFLDDPDRLGLKLAYLNALAEGRVALDLPADPYDAIAPLVKASSNGAARLQGKVEVPGWLRPRPDLADRELVRPEAYQEFMDRGGFKLFVERCETKAAEILPETPVMIAVDHGLAAGPIRAASRHYGAGSLAVVVLDQHFDAVSVAARAQGIEPGFNGEGLCGDFLAGLMRGGAIRPELLFVVGVGDFPRGRAADTAYGREYLSWVDKGVTVFCRDEVLASNFAERLTQGLRDSGARAVYVSLDADVGSGREMNAVRFGDYVGLPAKAVLAAARTLRSMMDQGDFRLAGLDVSEVDVHLLGLPGPEGESDRTAEICASFISILIGGEA